MSYPDPGFSQWKDEFPVHPVSASFHSASVNHLYIPTLDIIGRRAGQPSRESLCGSQAWESKNIRRIWHDVPDIKPDHTGCDPYHMVRWCPKCVGIAAQRTGVLDQVVEIVLAAFNKLET